MCRAAIQLDHDIFTEVWVLTERFKDEDVVQRMRDALRQAGLSECRLWVQAVSKRLLILLRDGPWVWMICREGFSDFGEFRGRCGLNCSTAGAARPVYDSL